eukprot:13018552-Alexandrium_andersonii.AAC.1
MSASLVGSEMCIRDSDRQRAGHLRRPRDHPQARRSERTVTPNRGPPGSVSYTHLTLPTICSV